MQTGDRKGAIQGLILTVLLGLSFTCVQAWEYAHAPFTFGFNNLALAPFTDPAHAVLAAGAGNFDAIYGSTFFMATGFHGSHVIIGTIFLTVCLGRAIAGQFTPTRHFGFEAAAWYWHFVDVVWLFLFVCIYVWGVGARCAGLSHASAATHRIAILKGLCPRCGQGPCLTAISRSETVPGLRRWTTPCSMPVTGPRCSAS